MTTLYYHNGHWYVVCLGKRYVTSNRVNAFKVFKVFRGMRCPA